MPYTNEEGGLINNFASEPKVYQAEPPDAGQRRTYIILGILAALFVGGLVFVAFAVSNAS